MSITLHKQLLSGRGQTGVYSVCSAHPWVIEAAALQAVADHHLLLLEATSNQVNQEGGYTGMRPQDFRDFALRIAKSVHLPERQLILGGDHLGPNPWSGLPADEAMRNARQMVALYVSAGFTKIHLDASMRCADDPQHLDDATVAARAASLCEAAEEAGRSSGTQPLYIIGTEVPPPGGASHSLQRIEVTTDTAVERTWQIHRDAFAENHLHDAWRRVTAIVVQPGVEFDHDSVIDYNPQAAAELKNFLVRHPELVFEAHSTDYQLPAAYENLIHDGFSILKVGPALTFALREALFALDRIEAELLPPADRADLRAAIETVMLASPQHWQRYYPGTPQQQKELRAFSYSDRIRYYWPDPKIQGAINKLMANLERFSIPETLLSQYLPTAHAQRCTGSQLKPKEIVIEHIRAVLRLYAAACYRGRLTPA
jgi:D-tagatose-1,6-bisphosphate aldolase subunit GatZ/KbaZ